MGSTGFSIYLSFKVALVATALVVVVGTLLAWVLARGRFRGRTLLNVVLTLPLVLPPTVTGYYLIVVFGRNGYLGGLLYQYTGWTVMFTWKAAVLASFVVALPLMIQSAKAAIESVDQVYVDAAYTLGYSELETFLRVILPMSKNGLIAGTVLAFARALGEFGATLMVAGNIPGRTDTMPIAIYGAAAGGEWEQAHMLVLLFTGISALFLLIALKLTRRSSWALR